MSLSVDVEEFGRWISMARRTLESAKGDEERGGIIIGRASRRIRHRNLP